MKSNFLNLENLKSDKDKLFRYLNKKNIFPQFHYKPLNMYSFYKKKNEFYIGAEKYFKSSLSIPLYYGIKKSEQKFFVILDAAMNDLMRPALYGATHKILPSVKANKKSKKVYEFVGPICESTDKFTTLNNFQKLKEKDFVAICDVGAYGMSLSSNYNVRPKPIELLIKGSKIKVIKKRQKHKDLM